ncbi:MAG: DMT family transporter [Candidatus Levybacteria bacterium]|nr:DMT family transporter [Candidatus Levybacteria bacterium]MBI2420684.1 DMT family transporter [Candidatus Levybacteria bacterium]
MNSEGKIRLAILALILANVIWGAAFPIYKWTLDIIPPFTFSFLRFFLGAFILLPFVWNRLNIEKQDILRLIFLSFVSVTVLIPLLLVGLTLTPSINAPIIVSSGPIFLIVASILFLKEKVRPKILLGTVISLAGVLLIILRPIIEAGFSGGILGNLFIFLATLCSVIQAILLKKLTVKNDPLAITFWMFVIGSLPLIPAVLWESQNFNFGLLNTQGIIGLSYGVILASAFAHFLLAYGIKYIKASEVGIFTYVDPIATVVIAVPLLSEVITPVYLVASFLVFAGIFVAEGRIHYHPFQKLRA